MAAKYDIFVSYRRSSFESAQMIATSLRAKGYKVFFDVESLRGGKFNEQLFSVISECRDFLVVLPEHALDRCSDPQDWVRLEVCHAMTCGKNIIPVMLSGFEWPDPMPFGMEELKMYQAVTAGSKEYYDLTIEKLCTYLKSVPATKKRLRKLLKISAWLVPVLLVLFGILRAASVPYCNRLGVEILNNLTYIDVLAESNKDVMTELNGFLSVLKSTPRPQRLIDAREDIISAIANQKKQVESLVKTTDGLRSVGPWHFMLLLSRGINPLDVIIEPQLLRMEYDSYLQSLESKIDNLGNEHLSPIDVKDMMAMCEIDDHNFRSAYYQYLAVLCGFPAQTDEALDACFKSLSAVPTEIVLGLSRGEYEKRAKAEMGRMEELIDKQERQIDERTDAWDEVNRKTEMLDQMLDSVEGVISGNEAELATREAKVQAKATLVDAKKDELAEINRQFEEVYETLREQCRINEDDTKGYKWGKILKFAGYLETMVKTRQSQSEDAYMHITIGPDVVYANLASMLNAFKAYHPESSVVADAAKVFYKEVSEGKHLCDGVMITAFKDDVEHPVHKTGDIIVAMKGETITDYESLRAAFKKEGAAKESFLRLVDGRLQEITVEDCGPVDVVGYSGMR